MRRLELAAVEFRVDQIGREVLARVVQVVVDLREQVVDQRAHPGHPFLGRQVDPFERVLDELAELGSVLGREPEHVGDDPHRNVLRVVARGVDDVLITECVYERVTERPGRWLLPPDRRLGECGQQQLARVVVERRIRGDRRRAADRRYLARRPEVAHDDRSRGETLGVVRDRCDVLIARRQPSAAESLRAGDGAPLSQIVLDGVRIGGPLRFEMREVRRPVGDRVR